MRISDWSSDVCSSDLVLHVGDVAVDLLVVLAAERQAPQRLANRLAGGSELRRQLVVVAEQAGVLVTERDDDGAGQRCQIDDQARLEVLLRVPQRIAQHEAAFRIGVQHFDGLARHRSEEHTSELQSLMRISYAVFCSKKKAQPKESTAYPHH